MIAVDRSRSKYSRVGLTVSTSVGRDIRTNGVEVDVGCIVRVGDERGQINLSY